MKSVILTSTFLQIEPADECRRWSKKDSQYVQVSRPNIVKNYNDCMGKIDLIDRIKSYYRMGARSGRLKPFFICLTLQLPTLGYFTEMAGNGLEIVTKQL